ncbi:hypothetical protein CNR22_03620 [Sphingobacteriaceae bacterium]|nr:hypothetical protein CNR22_03620 [Sphingobacteriaceae bacterium]
MNESINLLEELDNVSKIHVLDRDDIDLLMLEFGRKLVHSLRIERINVWLFNPKKDALISIGEYDHRSKFFKKDSVLKKRRFPDYFEALQTDKILLIPNVYNNKLTEQFNEIYSKPNDIISLMDIPLRIEAQLVGVICFEKTGSKEREFTPEEQTFALSVSMVLASNLEARYRRAAQAKLDGALKEKDLLIQEINHRVKNNFAILISLLRLGKHQGKSIDPALIFEEYEQRIFSMLKIQELLYQTKNYTEVNLCDYSQELVMEFKRSHPEVADNIIPRIVQLDWYLPTKSALHLGLIITEVFINSYKYAYPGNSNYLFTIDVKKSENGGVVIKIGDNGKGFDFKEKLKKNSLGLPLIKDLAEDIDLIAKFPDFDNNFYEFVLN